MKGSDQKFHKFLRFDEQGFSLVETVVALLVLLIVVMGVFSVLVYAINYNTANNTRAVALALLQKEEERLRSAKYTSMVIDSDLLGGEKPSKTILTEQGHKFSVKTVVDDDPFTTGIQIDQNKTLKEIYLTVTVLHPTPGWQTAVPTKVIVRRVRAN